MLLRPAKRTKPARKRARNKDVETLLAANNFKD